MLIVGLGSDKPIQYRHLVEFGAVKIRHDFPLTDDEDAVGKSKEFVKIPRNAESASDRGRLPKRALRSR